MGFLPKRLTLQNLDQVSVFIEDTDNQYFNVQDLPETLTQGRHAFKLFGSDLLREGIELKMELLDSEGNTIFMTPVDFIGEETPPHTPYRYVTIEVYSPPINYPGIATLTILGELNPNLVDVPIEFQNAYNVRYQADIDVDLSTIVNTQPIRFFKNPTTEFQEVVQAKTVLSPISESIVKTTADGLTRSDLKGSVIEIESGSLEKEALPNSVSDTLKDIRRFKDEFKYKTGLRGKVPSIIKRRGLSRRFASLEQPKFKIKTSDATFTSDMQGGTVEIGKHDIKIFTVDSITGQTKEEVVTVPKFKTKILEVLDDKTIIPEEPPIVFLPTGSQPVNTDIQEATIEDFSSAPITASFSAVDSSPSQSAVNFDSLLDLTIKDMRTFSGDIYRIRVHGKSEAAGADFTVLTDVIVESPELLKDVDSPSGVLRTGYFINQSHINTYWNKFSMDGTTKGNNVISNYNSSNIIDALNISGSNLGLNQSVVVETKVGQSFTIRKDVTYTLSAKVKGQIKDKVLNESGDISRKGKLYFNLSGSNINDSSLVTSHNRFGFELTDEATGEPVVLQLDEDVDGIQNFETIEHTFKPKFNLDRTVNTDTVLQLRAESGEWFISDLSLRPAMDTGFSPDEFDLKVPIPRSIRPDRFDFLIEYFDINNNVAETVTVLQDVPISGSALVIDGDGNLLTGSLFLGNAVDSGIEAAGVNSAFVRSVGYEGFESASLGGKGGFMIFSGSVLPDAPDNYIGAGIEIHDGTTGVDESFLKFRTNPSQFDVKTSTFFLGKKLNPANFISGSNGNLQISSSNFELTADGDVTMSGEISATGGTIGGFDIGGSTISTTGVILGNSSEDLFISSSAFKVDHSGNITASNIDLGGTISATSGDVGGFQINAGSLTSGTGNSAITMSSANKIISIGSGSTFNKGDLQGGFRAGIDTDGVFKFAIGNSDSFIHVDNDGVSIRSEDINVTASLLNIDVDIFRLNANNLFISSSEGGIISAGNPRPTDIDGTNKGFFVNGSAGKVLLGNSNGSHIKFDGTDTSISSSAFFLGSKAQFVSGSNGNIEISSSNFHLTNAGDVTMAGTITATAGQLGGFGISSDAISSDNFFISGGAENNQFFISSSAFNVKASGNVTASALQLSGGSAGGLVVSAGQIGVGEILKLKDSGQITGSSVLFTGGKIASFDITDNVLSNSPNFFISGSATGNNFFISSSNFNVKASGDVTGSAILLGDKSGGQFLQFAGDTLTVQGNISADSISTPSAAATPSSSLSSDGLLKTVSASIGGFEIDDHSIRTTGIEFNNSTQPIFISSSAFKVDHSGNVTASNVDLSGKITATSGEIGGFTIDDDLSNSAGSTLKLKGSTGQITASAANITGDITANTITANTAGTIANFEISSTEIKSSNNLLRLKSNGQITGSSAQITGNITATSGQIAGFTISGDELTATNFTLDASGKSISLGTGNTIFIADADEGIQLGHASFNSAPFSVTKAGELKATSGTIGGWSLSANTIVGANLTLNSSGLIETNDFASGVKGFRLDSTNNGQAEFENISIRGTLKTTVFEKETVNAVGGQLYVANSTTLTGSLAISASAATMSVVNVTGFTGSYANDGEILVAKKITDTGFSTEYILVQSASRDNPSSDTDFSGKLFVVRGYQSGSSGDFLGDNANLSQSLAPGQVLASTGRIGTGYIRLNANPNDTTTPFIDIVERTGSGVFDVDLKARLGDLSGLSTTKLHGTDPANAGFGLYSQNVFLEGGIVANTGSIGGIEMEAGKLYNGVGVHGNSNTGFYVDSSSKFSLGDKLVWDGSDLSVEGSITLTGGTGVATPSDVSASLNASSSALQDNIDNVESNVSGAFTETSASIATDLNTVESNISGAFTEVSASIVQNIVTDISGSILDIPPAPGGEGLFLNFPHMGYFSGTEFTAFISASGGFLFKADDDNLISFGQTVTGGDGIDSKSFVLKSDNVFLSGSKVNILGERFFLGGQSQFVSGSNGNIEISSSRFHVKPDGDIVVQKVTATEGSIGGYTIDGHSISTTGVEINDSTQQIFISSSAFKVDHTGNVTASNVDLSGKITATSGEIGGFDIDSDEIKSGTNISLNSNDKSLSINNGTFGNTGIQLQFNGGTPRMFVGQQLGEFFKFDGTNVEVSSSKFFFGNNTNFISGSLGNISIQSSGVTTLSGSQVTIETPKFFLGGSSQFVSGSNGNIEISSSKFHIQPDGDVITNDITASNANVSGKITSTEGSIGGFDIGTSQISSSTGGLILNSDGGITGSKFLLEGGIITDSVTIEGSLSANSISTPTGGSPLAQITDQGFAKFVSASIGGFDISQTEIKDTDEDLILKSSGQITASAAQITGELDITGGATKTQLDVIGQQTASLDASVSAIGETTASLNTATGSLQSDIDTGLALVSSSVSGAFTDASASLATNLNTVEANVSGAFTEVSASIVEKIVTDSTGSILEVPPSPAGSGLYLNFPHMGFYDGAEPASTTYIVTAPGGSSGGFYIDGVQRATLELQVGYTYRFNTSAVEGSHPFRFSTDSDNDNAYTTGVTVGSGYVDIVVTSSTPSTLYYYCTAHDGMGGQVNVVDNSEYKAFISASGGFLFKADNNNLISFGQSVDGGDGTSTKSFVLRSDNVFLSGSNVNILGERFFLGGQAQFISGSNGNLEITSSNFHLDRDGNVTLDGTITATTGEIGGFSISSNSISSSNDILRLKSSGQITASAIQLTGEVNITGGSAKSHLEQIGESTASLNTSVVEIGQSTSSLDASVVSIGQQTQSLDNSVISIGEKSASLDASVVSIGAQTASLDASVVSIGAQTASLDTSVVALGSTTASIQTVTASLQVASASMAARASLTSTGLDIFDSGSNKIAEFSGNVTIGKTSFPENNVFIDNDSVEIRRGSQVSASFGSTTTIGPTSNKHVKITSDALEIKTDANTTVLSASAAGLEMVGTINASAGDIGGFGISATTISSSNSDLILNSNGQITASAVSMSGTIDATSGLIGGMRIESNSIESAADSGDGSVITLTVQASGNDYFIIDGVNQPTLTFLPGNTYRFDLSDDSTSTHPFRFVTSGDGSSSVVYTEGVTSSGNQGDPGAYRQIAVTQNTPTNLFYRCTSHSGMGNSITVDKTSPLILDGNTGQISGSRFLFTGGKISGSSVEIDVENVKISGSSVDISTPKFFLGGGGQFISGSNQNIEISSSNFHLQPDGDVVMSGTVTATTGEIGGFAITSTAISSSDTPSRLILRSTGQITASAMQMTGEVNIAGGSAQTHLELIGEQTASLNTSVVSIGAQTASLDTSIVSIGAQTASLDASVVSIGEKSASLDTSVVSIGAQTASLNTSVVSIGAQTASLDTSVVSIGQQTQSLDNSVISIGEKSASLDASVVSIGAQTASLDTSVVSIGATTASIQTVTASLQVASASMASTAALTATGLDIFDSGSNRIAQFSGNVTIGKTSFPENNVFIDEDSVEIRRGSQVSASFGSTTTIGPTTNKHVKITSDALEIKTDVNTTVLSASAAGLEMSGSIKATGGEVGGFFISPNEISSSLSRKRGLVLKPGDAIRGFGNSVHTTVTVPGKFSFGVGTISPAADSPAPFSGDLSNAPGGKFQPD